METITKISQHIMNVMRKVFGKRRGLPKEESQKEAPGINFGEHRLGEKENALQSCHFSDLQISVSFSKGIDSALKVATSYPHNLSEDDAILFSLQIPEITWIDGSITHEVVFHLSAPVSPEQVYDRIVEMMFCHLCLKYEWMYLRQTIYILKGEDDYSRIFFLRLETRNHLRLLHILLRVRGIDPRAFLEEDLASFMAPGGYEIVLFRVDSFDWDEIMPSIEEVFNNYFLRGVDFVPMNE